MVTRRSFIGSVVGALVVGGVGGYLGKDFIGPSTGGIDPVLGFTGLTLQTKPPRQVDHEVQLNIKPRMPIPIPEFYFEPSGLFIQPGQTVKFSASTPHHTVSSFHPLHGRTPRVPDGVPAFSSPLLPVGSYWLYTFEKEGVYDLFCGPHEYFGMVMRVVVGSATGPGASTVPPPLPLPEEGQLLPPLLTSALVLTDPALNANNIIQKGKVSWDELNPDSKKLMLTLAP
jgi:plastocyanin